MFGWLREFLELRREFKEIKPCESCEYLKLQLAISQQRESSLIAKLLEKPEPVVEQKIDTSHLNPILPKHIPWAVRRQMLEREDRDTAKKLAEANKETNTPKVTPINADRVTKLEEELGVSNGN